MGIREIAYGIFEQLSEEELQGVIALYRKVHPQKKDDVTERREAFERMKNVCRYISDLDEQKQLGEYRDEKYGE